MFTKATEYHNTTISNLLDKSAKGIRNQKLQIGLLIYTSMI